MMFADAEPIQPDLVGKHDFLDQISQPLGQADAAVPASARLCECVYSYLHDMAFFRAGANGSPPQMFP
ncbi:hypothetical protein OEG84_24235 [Hoeflea sp. G2-23]|uniref:Uncharacterized protein n=1 Tax=Hoeflea algicola TaxID=2983763 RepID=A0ABT3ZGI3_9HYPH|nr:hypothetical protein [Hoeflea algicola]MCY0150721.1 hypothetical protein [Hoeflea algicola]